MFLAFLCGMVLACTAGCSGDTADTAHAPAATTSAPRETPTPAAPSPGPVAAQRDATGAPLEPRTLAPGLVTVHNELGGFALDLPADHALLPAQDRFPGRWAYRYGGGGDGDGQRVVIWTGQRSPRSIQEVAEMSADDQRFGLVEIRAWDDGRFLAVGQRRGRHRLRVLGNGLIATCGGGSTDDALTLAVCASVRPL